MKPKRAYTADETRVPRVITDCNQHMICILPPGLPMTDRRWELIWETYDRKGDTLTHEELRAIFPEEPALAVNESGRKFSPDSG